MIIFANPAKPFSFNSKGAARRSVVLSEYDREIEALYDTLEERIEEESPSTWTPEASLAFVRTVVNKNLHHPVKDDEDIFECGCDRYVKFNTKLSVRDVEDVLTAYKPPGFATQSYLLYAILSPPKQEV